MTTEKINEKFQKLNAELNKVKTYNTRLSKKLIEHNIEVPVPNWQDSPEQNPKPKN